ncbi:MAG: hypothetical protein KIT09_00745 [Bryobacteraceae bacterium]|nr:hypothetical protein [Bryobacteraceae bacterium]
MNRRDLLSGSLKALAATPALGTVTDQAATAVGCGRCATAGFQRAPSPRARLTVKPIMTNMIHSGVWEGPCRFNVVSVARETENVNRAFERWSARVRSGEFGFGERVEVREPALITFDEDFTLPAAALAGLDKEGREADVFLIAPHGSSNAAFDLVRHFHKPAALLGLDCRTVDVAAYARTQGEEIFVANDNRELQDLLDLLSARKAFRETSVLFPTERGFPSVASLTGISDLEDLKKRHGVAVKTISYKGLSEAMERRMSAEPARREAEELAGDLMRYAAHSYIDKEYVIRSALFYGAVQELMDVHACNAFTIECFEFCSSRLPEKWKITPCLIHTLLKDEGLASSCEGDMGALLAMRLLMSVSGKSSHLGNMFFRDGAVIINHSAPGIKMNGFDSPGLPYKLGRFVQSGWGTKVVVDFAANEEKRVTVARMHPNARKLLVMKGTLAGSEGWDKDELGCSVVARVKPAESGNGEPFVRKQTEYGNHLVWVYGDYAGELARLGELMGVEVETIV